MKKVFILLVCAGFLFTAKAQKGYSGCFEAGYTSPFGEQFMSKMFSISTVHGYKFNNHFFLGGGVGYKNGEIIRAVFNDGGVGVIFQPNYVNTHLLPVFIRVKGILLNKRLSPFLTLDGGYTFDIPNQRGTYFKGMQTSGFIYPHIGLDVKISEKTLLYVSAGVNLQFMKYQSCTVLEMENNFLITTPLAIDQKLTYATDIRIGFTF